MLAVPKVPPMAAYHDLDPPIAISVYADKLPGHVNLTVPFLNRRETHTLTSTLSNFTLNTSIIARNNGKENKAIYLEADTDITVHVIVNSRHSAAREGFLALPIAGTDFVVSSYTPRRNWGFSSGYIIAGVHDNTRITVRAHNTQKTVLLNRFETYQMQTTEFDPSGTVIHSDKPASVFANSQCPFVPADAKATCSSLLDQIPSIDSWGSTYIVPPLENNVFTVIRIYTGIHATGVTLTNSSSTINVYLQQYTYKEFIFGTQPMYIHSNSKIQVVMYGFTGYSYDSNDDTFMTVLPSTEHFLSAYRFSTQNDFGYKNSLLITIKHSEETGLLLNGAKLRYTSKQNLNTPVGLYSVLNIPVSQGLEYSLFHQRNAEFGTILYGQESGIDYGYCLGKKLSSSDSEFTIHF